MKIILQIFIVWILITVSLYSNDFRDIHEISLKKDEHTNILVKYAGEEKLFKFRWTLYTNGGLVIHRSYDRIVSQNILYLRYKNQTIRQELKPRGADFYNVPYLLVKFKKFDSKEHKAVFEIFLSDEKMQIELKYLKK